MKKTVLIGIVLLALLVTAPTFAKNEPIGQSIDLFCAPWVPSFPDCLHQTFQAGEPFYIMHGWEYSTLGEENNGSGPLYRYAYFLSIDGESMPYSFRYREKTSNEPNVWGVWYGYEFPAGMEEGVYTFTSEFLAPCKDAVEYFGYSGSCKNPNEPVYVGGWDVTIEFIP